MSTPSFPCSEIVELPTHELGEDEGNNLCPRFDIDWNSVFYGATQLVAARLGYNVKFKGQIRGGREPSPIWRYGADLVYVEDDNSVQQYWLCKLCHLSKRQSQAKKVHTTSHIAAHMLRAHHIDVHSGLEGADIASTAIRVADAGVNGEPVAGSGSAISHSLWQEEQLQSALIDWTMIEDLSFGLVCCSATRGLLTWNRNRLLRALPSSPGTLSTYIQNRLKGRKEEVKLLLQRSFSQISVSSDLWTSPNGYAFMAVIAHFLGKFRRHGTSIFLAY